MNRHVSVATAYDLREAGLKPHTFEIAQHWYDENTGYVKTIIEYLSDKRVRMKNSAGHLSSTWLSNPALVYVPTALEIIAMFPEPNLVTLRLVGSKWKATLQTYQKDMLVEKECWHMCPHEAVARLYIQEAPNFPLSLHKISKKK